MKRWSVGGFSLIEVILALGILSFLAIASIQLFSNQMELSGFVKTRIQAESLRREITDFLAPSGNCTASLAGTHLGAPIGVAQLRNSSGEVRYAVAADVSADLKIAKIEFGGFKPTEPTNIANRRGQTELKVELEVLRPTIGPQVVSRKLRLYVEAQSLDPTSPDYLKLALCSSQPLGAGVDSMTDMCVSKRSVSITKDSIAWCPSDYPRLFACNGIDDEAPDTPYRYTTRCLTDGLCNTGPGGGTPIEERRTGAGGSYLHTERVKMQGPTHKIEGCLVYDEDHLHTQFRIDLYCCR
ncbi:MAG: hypothetical protein NDI61_10390 [Bdellovibrionaceae bacterium]|nr:hypothetical protein [Pseudobdellovibrionaceae bacterium]